MAFSKDKQIKVRYKRPDKKMVKYSNEKATDLTYKKRFTKDKFD